MRTILIACLMGLALTANSTQQTAAPQPAARRSLGAFFEKLRDGKPVTVAYLGGSVTQGAGASDAGKTSYRALVTGWLRSRYPNVRVHEINAAAGGTGSLYGALRVRRDVVEQKPDLVFIEFATSDADGQEEAVKRALEGIVRQLLAVPSPPEIALLYATTAKRAACVEWHEAVAGYYHLPSVNLQEGLWQRIDSGQVNVSVLGKDGVHPNDEGHKLYAGLITDFLTRQEPLKASPPVKNLIPPLISDELTYGEAKPFAEIEHNSSWRTDQSADKTLPALLLVTEKTGTELTTTFDGSVVGITYRVGPDCGVLECLIDGRPAPEPLARIDAYDTTHRLGTRVLAGGLEPGEHKLTIRVRSDRNAKSTGNHIRLGALLFGGQRPERL